MLPQHDGDRVRAIKVGQYVLCKVVEGHVEMMVVVNVGDIFTHAKNQATMERFATELGRKLKLK